MKGLIRFRRRSFSVLIAISLGLAFIGIHKDLRSLELFKGKKQKGRIEAIDDYCEKEERKNETLR